MKADLTRDTFDPVRHFSRVLLQQGRVQLDADFNEQTAALHHYLRCLAADLIGRHGGPGDSFKLVEDTESTTPDLVITRGHYYVNGLLCENDRDTQFSGQPDYPIDEGFKADTDYLVFLHAWEQLVTAVQDSRIREVALGGPDTAARARVVWQVKAVPITGQGIPAEQAYLKLDPIREQLAERLSKSEQADIPNDLKQWPEERVLRRATLLKARAKVAGKAEEPCPTSPEARYRGPENQLYRVEVHTPGDAETATFKWSRDNGSVIFPIRSLTISSGTTPKTTVDLEHLGRDARTTVNEGDWVEIEDDHSVLRRVAIPLLRVSAVNRIALQVTLTGSPPGDVGQVLTRNPLLRLWNHRAGDQRRGGLKIIEETGTAVIKEGAGNTGWLNLEDGIQIQFQEGNQHYCSGDYWLIPARTATGDVEWPGTTEDPLPLPPHGVDHHLAPLAVVSFPTGDAAKIIDCRRSFGPLAQPVSP
jgi:hypothetical protein